jgi:hypothetical protein
MPLFSSEDSLVRLPIQYCPPSTSEPDQVEMPTIMDFCSMRQDALIPGQAVSVKTIHQFQFIFNSVHANVLHRLHDILLHEPVVIAGGSVLRALTVGDELRPPAWWQGKGDVDLFLYAETAAEATRLSRPIFDAVAVDGESWLVFRTSGVITMIRVDKADWDWKLDQKIQIVLRLYQSPAEVLVGFDCDSCCCCYDGREVWATPRGLRALKTGTNTLNPGKIRSPGMGRRGSWVRQETHRSREVRKRPL